MELGIGRLLRCCVALAVVLTGCASPAPTPGAALLSSASDAPGPDLWPTWLRRQPPAPLVEPPPVPRPEPKHADRSGFQTSAPTDADGVDEAGWFHAPDAQPEPPPGVLRMLADTDLAEDALRAGLVTRASSLEDNHTLFRATLVLAPKHAALVGVPSVEICVKPEGSDWYGREYRRELAFYRVARYLGAGGVAPMVERELLWEPIADEVDPQLTGRQRGALRVFADAAGDARIRGSVQLWAGGYRTVVGARTTNGYRVAELVSALGPDHDAPTDGDPIWRGLSDMIVLDYLLYNSDRNEEFGSVRLPDGGQRLVMLDAGDALNWFPPDGSWQPWDGRFAALGRVNAQTYKRLSALDEATLRALWRSVDGTSLGDERHVARVADRARAAVSRVDALIAQYGAATLFAERGRHMGP